MPQRPYARADTENQMETDKCTCDADDQVPRSVYARTVWIQDLFTRAGFETRLRSDHEVEIGDDGSDTDITVMVTVHRGYVEFLYVHPVAVSCDNDRIYRMINQMNTDLRMTGHSQYWTVSQSGSLCLYAMFIDNEQIETEEDPLMYIATDFVGEVCSGINRLDSVLNGRYDTDIRAVDCTAYR